MDKDKPKKGEHYQKAKQEWDNRIGNAHTQERHWRMACLISCALSTLLAVVLILSFTQEKQHVYVAEVNPQHQVIRVQATGQQQLATAVQKEAFIARFIQQIMSLSLDPIVARTQWLNAYQDVKGPALGQLNSYAKGTQPFAKLGKDSKDVVIDDFHPIDNQSYQFTWTQTIYNNQGAVESKTPFSGVFTVVDGKASTNTQALLRNPLGLQIVQFHFKKQGSIS